MTIMKSCCFFKNVWNGSFASGIYTMIYFAFSSLILLIYVIDEWDYLMGWRQKPKGETIIEKGDITETHVIFNIIVLISSVGLVGSSIIMLYGLKKDKRELLLPWMMLMIVDDFVELAYAIFFIFSKAANFDPIVGFIFTIDLFIICLNTYCLLCVMSQYQEYKEILNRTSTQLNAINLTETVTTRELPVPVETSQIQRSTKNLLPTFKRCLAISAIPEENVSETHI